MPLTFIYIGIILVLILISVPGSLIIYRYTRPKTQAIKTMLTGEAILVALLLIGTVFSLVQPQTCPHPMPPISSTSASCVPGILRLGGSTALQPLVAEVAKSYQRQCPGANFIFSPTKSETGLDSVEDGSIDIGDSDVYSSPEKSDLIDTQIAVAIFAVIVNNKVGITNLTSNQIQDIYSGKDTNWKDLGGPDLAIHPLSRASGSGTRFTFDTYILKSSEQVPQITPMEDTQKMITQVQNTQGAIGYAALHDVSANQQSLITVTLDGGQASPATVITNAYKFWTIEHLYTKKGQATKLAAAFINYMGSKNARQIMQDLSFIDIHAMNVDALPARCPSTM